MPRADRPDERFSVLLLQLRGRLDVTQRELAARLRVHMHTVQAWEAGVSLPGAANLQALIESVLLAGGFTSGQEAQQAAALWAAAAREAPRLRTPFDEVWFGTLLGERAPEARTDVAAHSEVAAAPPPEPTSTRRQSWGDAPDVVSFLGRSVEREQVRHWVQDERCRLVTLLGLGGIGKTLLATRIAHDLAPTFERVYWRSLRNAPSPGEWVAGAISFLTSDEAPPVRGAAARTRVIDLLSETRCLLVLDNFETVLEGGDRTGAYRPDYDGYGELLRRLAEAPHQSCLLVTTREEPSEIGPLRGNAGPVRRLDLGGFDLDSGQKLLRDKRLDGDLAAWGELIGRFGGNGLALKMVGETIRDLFDGSIAEYLRDIPVGQGVLVGGIRQLLDTQIERLSQSERDVLRWLAVEREPLTFPELAVALGGRLGRGALLEAVERLRRRALLERGEQRSSFVLHSVVLEYVTAHLIDEVVQEIVAGRPDRLLLQPLVKATAPDYARKSQERLIGAPLLDRLILQAGSTRMAEQRLLDLLAQQREHPSMDQGYLPGNVVNVLRLLRGHLRGLDLSGLAIRQAYVQDVEAQDSSLAGARISESVLAEAFTYLTSLALSADGRYLAGGASTGEVYVWRVADRALLATLRGVAGGAWALALSADGDCLAVGSSTVVVSVWRVGNRTLLATLAGHTGGVRGVALSDDARVLASGSFDGTVRLWDAQTWQPRTVLRGHAGGIYDVALSGDGSRIASGSFDGTVRLWEAASGRVISVLAGHAGGVRSLAMSGDGQRVASASFDGTVKLWTSADGALVTTLQGHAGGVWSVALSRDGQRVASGSFDGTVRIWDATSAQVIATLQEHAGSVWGVALSGDGGVGVSASEDASLRLWDTERGRLLTTLRGHTAGVWGVALAGDGRLVASGSVDGTIRWWDTETGRLLSTRPAHEGGVRGIALSQDGRLLASASHDAAIGLWDAPDGRRITTLSGQSGGVWAVALSADGRLVANGSEDGTIRLWETQTRRLLGTLHGHPGGVRGLALSTDGRRLLSGGEDGEVRLWDTASGQTVLSLEGHRSGVWAVAMRQDAGLLVGGSYDGPIRLWESDTGRLLATPEGHAGLVYALAVSADGQLLASGGADGTVRLWDIVGGRLLAVLAGHTGSVYGVSLSTDGRLLASGSIDGTVRLWQTSDGSPLRTLRADRRYERLDITGLTGIAEAQREALVALGAVESDSPPA